MPELYISSETVSVSLEEVMNATSVYFQHMTAEELRECLLKPIYNKGDLPSVVTILLDKAGLSFESTPEDELLITTCYGEPCILSSIELFGL